MPFDYESSESDNIGKLFETAPAGIYHLAVVAATERVSKGGDPQVVCRLEIIGGEYAGVRVTHYVTFKKEGEKGRGIAMNFLSALDLPHKGKFTVNPDEWVGRVVRAKINVEEFNSVERNKIEWVSKPDGGVPSKMDNSPEVETEPLEGREDIKIPF